MAIKLGMSFPLGLCQIKHNLVKTEIPDKNLTMIRTEVVSGGVL